MSTKTSQTTQHRREKSRNEGKIKLTYKQKRTDKIPRQMVKVILIRQEDTKKFTKGKKIRIKRGNEKEREQSDQ